MNLTSLHKKILIISAIIYSLVFVLVSNKSIFANRVLNINNFSYELTTINKIPVSKIYYDLILIDKQKIEKKDLNKLYFIFSYRSGRANNYEPQKLTFYDEDKKYYYLKLNKIFRTSSKICKQKNRYIFDDEVCLRSIHERSKHIYLKKKNIISNIKLKRFVSSQCHEKIIYGNLADIKFNFCKQDKKDKEVKFEIFYHDNVEIFKEYISFNNLDSEIFGVASNGKQSNYKTYFTSQKNFIIKKKKFENYFNLSNFKGLIFDKHQILFILNDYRLDQFNLNSLKNENKHPHYFFEKKIIKNISFKKNNGSQKSSFHVKSFKGDDSYLLTKHHSINNFNSAHMFADHADNSTNETLKALYFGKSNFDLDIDQKIEGLGFIGNSIPITQSFFYNFDESEYKKRFDDPLLRNLNYAYLKKDSTLKIANEIRKFGSEIAIHTMSYFTDTDENLLEGLKFIKNEKIKTWIDHSLTKQTENLSNSAYKRSINKKKLSEYYYEHGLRNFWVGASENNNNGNTDINMFYINGKEAFQQTVWTNDLYGDNFRIFPSIYVRNKKKAEYYNKKNLKKFSDNLGYTILHTYLTGVGKYKNKFYYNYDNEKKLFTISPEFNEMLRNLKTFQDEGLIWNTTVGEFVDHQIYIKNIIIKKIEHNKFKLINNNKEKKNISIIINKMIDTTKNSQKIKLLENSVISSKSLEIIKIKNLSKNSIMVNMEIGNGDHFLKIN